jgi:hypothetical protein
VRFAGTPAQDNLEQNLDVGGEAEELRLDTPVFEKYNALLHGGVTTSSGRGANKKKEVLSIPFVKKYIQYAKNRILPVLTKGAADYIVSVYASLRNDDLASNTKRVSPFSFLPQFLPLAKLMQVGSSLRRLPDLAPHCPYARDAHPSFDGARQGPTVAKGRRARRDGGRGDPPVRPVQGGHEG